MTGTRDTSAEPRSGPGRRRDTQHRLTHDIDIWVASASAEGAPYLVPLSFDWDGEALLAATPAASPTGRNLAASRTARMALGHTRDVSMIDGEVEVLEIDALPPETADRFAARSGFDPRAENAEYRWYRISPRRIQAWREVNELPDRELMRDGRWLVEPGETDKAREADPARQTETRLGSAASSMRL
ncbi:MAG: pyridoxamine 5'-phosphate oxidase family protein [Thermoleophilaceae bacterium]